MALRDAQHSNYLDMALHKADSVHSENVERRFTSHQMDPENHQDGRRIQRLAQHSQKGNLMFYAMVSEPKTRQAIEMVIREVHVVCSGNLSVEQVTTPPLISIAKI